MKKFILIILIATSGNLIAQTSNSTILNVNIYKNLSDYNYSVENLIKVDDNYSIELYKLKSEQNHFLSKNKFDAERAFFDNNGILKFILLQRNFKTKKLLKNESEEIMNSINTEYGNFTLRDNEITVWKTKKHKILMQNVKNEIYVAFLINDLVENGEVEKENKDTITKDNRVFFVNTANDLYRKFPFKDKSVSRFSRNEKNDFYTYIEYKFLDSDKDYVIEKNLDEHLAKKIILETFKQILDGEAVKNFITKELNYDKFIFIVDVTYDDFSKKTIKKTIYNFQLKNLKIPFTENEFYNILF